MPCNLGQRALAEHVATGVRAAGGTPLEFDAIAVCGRPGAGTAGMRASLVSREVIAGLDGGARSAAASPSTAWSGSSAATRRPPGRGDRRCSASTCPGLVLCSGAMAAGERRGAALTIQDVWESRWARTRAVFISDEELDAMERDACPGFGACTGQFTANTMAVAVDFLGLGPIGLGEHHRDGSCEGRGGRDGRPARARRDRARRSPEGASSPARRSRTRSSASPAPAASTDGALRLLAIADEAGVELRLEDFDRLSAATPVVTSLTHGRSDCVAGDLHRVGGDAAGDEAAARPPAHGDAARPVDGTYARRPCGCRSRPRDGEVVASIDSGPSSRAARSRVLRGNLAPDGAGP